MTLLVHGCRVNIYRTASGHDYDFTNFRVELKKGYFVVIILLM